MALTPKQQLFCEYYLVENNATQAAIKAGYSAKTAMSMGSENLQKPEIAAYIEQRRSEKTASIRLDREKMLDLWTQIALADPNELAEVRRHCCRYCHGHEHRYQWTQNEFMKRCEEVEKRNERRAEDDQEPLPDPGGGFGYHPKHDPHPDCPECFGEGVVQTFVKDTRKLSPAAKRLFSGVKQTANGIEISAHSQEKARDNIAKNLGMLKDHHEHSGAIDTGDKTTRQVAIAAMALFRKTIES